MKIVKLNIKTYSLFFVYFIFNSSFRYLLLYPLRVVLARWTASLRCEVEVHPLHSVQERHPGAVAVHQGAVAVAGQAILHTVTLRTIQYKINY